MITAEELRDEIIEFLKQKYTAASAKFDGCNCSAAELALPTKKGILRYSVYPSRCQKSISYGKRRDCIFSLIIRSSHQIIDVDIKKIRE